MTETAAAGRRFPPGFLWGAGTSAYQVEGSLEADGRGESVWDVFARRPGAVEGGVDAAVACDSYRRWRDDVALVAELGLGAYRFSVAWSRVQPDGARVEARGLDHYERVVDALLDAGVVPVLTLNHWDMPQALMAGGGWAGRSTVDAFARYADAVGARLADRVPWWITQNEPWVLAVLGYQKGLHAPGVADLAASFAAAHHLLLGHGAAADALRGHGATGVGVALSLFPCDPASGSDADRDAAYASDGYVNRWFLDALTGRGYPADTREQWARALAAAPGASPDRDVVPTAVGTVVRDGDEAAIGRVDVIGVNYYTRRIVAAAPPDPAGGRPFPWRVVPPPGDARRTDEGWEVLPDALRALLLRLAREYAVPLLITENGGVYGDGPVPDGTVPDERRTAFLHDHLVAVHDALADGADVRGYLHWSLLDNFEWALGYRPRFGLVHVDYPTGRRIIKGSGWYYARVARDGELPAVGGDGEGTTSVPGGQA